MHALKLMPFENTFVIFMYLKEDIESTVDTIQ